MIKKAKQGCFDVVIFWKLDRFCRSLVDLVKIKKKLNEHDVEVQSVTEDLGTSSAVERGTYWVQGLNLRDTLSMGDDNE